MAVSTNMWLEALLKAPLVPGAQACRRQKLILVSCFQCWGAAACCSWRRRVPLPGAWSQAKWSFLFVSSFLLLFSIESWLIVKLSAVSCGAVRLIAVWLRWSPAESLHCLFGMSKHCPLLSCLALRLLGHLQFHFFPPPLSFPCRSLRSF